MPAVGAAQAAVTVSWPAVLALPVTHAVAVYRPTAGSVQVVKTVSLPSVTVSPVAQAPVVYWVDDGVLHVEQARSTVVLPSAEVYCDVAHRVFETHTVAALASWSQVPAAQTTAGAVSPAQYEPAAQAAHMGGDVLVPGEVWVVPAAQVPAGKHTDWLGPEV